MQATLLHCVRALNGVLRPASCFSRSSVCLRGMTERHSADVLLILILSVINFDRNSNALPEQM